MVEREHIVSFLKSKGPSVPNDIKRALGGDTMIFGAMLSELISRGSVLITKVKKGSSPFYYVPGQEPKLEKLIEFCNPKDQKTIAILKDKKVLRDKSLELFERVSLRQVPDFSKELKVQTAQGEMLFWRYFLVSEDEAIGMLKKHYNKAAEKEAPKKPAPQPVEKKEPVQEVAEAKKPTPAPQPVQAPTPQKFTQEKQEQLTSPAPLDKTEFHSLVLRYFSDNNIAVLSQDQLTKNREYEFVVKVPSALGSMDMYCRARNKKKLNEGDVAPALLKAKTKDLPCIFLTNGDFTKKSLAIIDKEYKGIVIKKI